MKTIKYYCNHCENRFEAEEKEGMECPRCFWSSSVIHEEDRIAGGAAKGASQTKPTSKGFSFNASKFVGVFFAIISLAVLISLFIFVNHFRGVMEKKGIKFSLPKNSASSDSKEAASKEGKSGDPNVPIPPTLLLTPEEQAILDRKISLTADRAVSEDEKKILEHRAQLSTGMVQSLPSQAFSLEKFKKMIEDQEKIYRLPIERSYQGKLEKIFKEKYLPAKDAFEAGDLRKARDLWVESLVFPIYGNDVRKHRGVILTMIKPFIADTLSKIGAINHSLVEERVRAKENETAAKYQALFDQIGKKDWQQAVSLIQELMKNIDELDNPQLLGGSAPPYPESINRVDQDIQGTLFQLLEVPPPPTAALNSVRADIQAKLRIAESFLPNRFEDAQKKYHEALDAIHRKDWKAAEGILKQIDMPLAFQQDAKEKGKVIQKLQASIIAGETAQEKAETVPVTIKK